MFCDKCGRKMDEGELECRVCTPNFVAFDTVPEVRYEQPTAPLPQQSFCSSCGSVLQEGQMFCQTCGHTVETYNASVQPTPGGKLKKILLNKKVIIIAAAVLVVAVLAIVLLPGMMKTPQDYMAEGDYEAAYEKADGKSEKNDVKKENLVAYVSNKCVDSLKDSESFDLREAWVEYDETPGVVLKVAANNSYGNIVINYWYYLYDETDQDYYLVSSVSDLEREEVEYWMDDDEEAEVLMDNWARSVTRRLMNNSSTEVDKESIDNINDLFEKDMLEDVELLSVNEP